MSGASTIAGLGSHQSAYATVATGIDEKIFGHWQDTSQGKSDVHQSDTDTDQKLPIYESSTNSGKSILPEKPYVPRSVPKDGPKTQTAC